MKNKSTFIYQEPITKEEEKEMDRLTDKVVKIYKKHGIEAAQLFCQSLRS